MKLKFGLKFDLREMFCNENECWDETGVCGLVFRNECEIVDVTVVWRERFCNGIELRVEIFFTGSVLE